MKWLILLKYHILYRQLSFYLLRIINCYVWYLKNDTLLVSAIGSAITCFISAFVTIALFITIKNVYNDSFYRIKKQINCDSELKIDKTKKIIINN